MTELQIIFFFLVFLFPVATYLGVLSAINRREHPLMVSGVWDAVGLLLAGSGFLLAAGPAVLSAFYDRGVRALLIQEGGNALHAIWEQWWILWALYYGAVLVGSIGLMLLRRNATVIYNIAPWTFDSALTQVLERLGLVWARHGNVVFLRRPSVAVAVKAVNEAIQISPHAAAVDVETVAEPDAELRSEMTLHIDPFPALHNVTLHWHGSATELRQDIENDLQRVLTTLTTHDNPCAGWFFGISCTLFVVMSLTVVLMVGFTLLMLATWG